MWYFADLTVAILLVILVVANTVRVCQRTGRVLNPQPPDLIAPITVGGKEVKDDELGRKLAGLLEARMHKLDRDLRSNVIVFDFNPLEPTTRVRTDDLFGVTFRKALAPKIMQDISAKLDGVSLPISVFKPPTVSAEYKGVELGAVARWIHERLHSERILKLSLQNSENQWIISGNLGDTPTEQVLLEVQAKNEAEALEKVAIYIWRRELEKIDSHIAALTEDEFETLAELLVDYSDHQERERAGRYDPDTWQRLAGTAEDIARKVPSWPEINLLAGSAYVRALDFEKARTNYEKARQLYQIHSKDDTERLASIDKVIDTIATLDINTYVTELTSRSNEQLRKLLRVQASPDVKAKAKIAIVGGLPPAALFQLPHVKRVGQKFSSDPNYEKDDWHTGNVARMAQVIAGDTSEILVAAMHDGDGHPLVNNIKTLRQAKPDVMAVAYSGKIKGADVFPDDVMVELAGALSDGIIVILPIASNEPGSEVMNLPVLSDESGRFMIVSSVDENGRKADFGRSAPGVFWLPGTGIPEINQEGKVLYGKGVSYSVGLAAGVIGRLKSQFPDASPEELLGALRTTASVFNKTVPDSEPVLDTDSAKTSLDQQKVPDEPTPN